MSHPPKRSARPGKTGFTLRLLHRFCLFVLLAFVLGFGYFATNARRAAPDPEAHTDAIVVLTGGSGRISAGVALLKAGMAGRLFISGVNPTIENGELARLTHQAGDLFACCVVLGHLATDTVGNAAESAAWMQAQHYTSLRLVTSDYHMPRALLDFRMALPEATIVPNPVHPPAATAKLWPLMAGEYAKYLITLARYQMEAGP